MAEIPAGIRTLIIRQEQFEVLEQAARKAFEDRTYRHLQEYFPHHCDLLGEDQMRRVIRHGWQKAESYDLNDGRCVQSYIDLMCLLGGGFDTDTLLPWAAEILNDRSSPDQVERGDRLYHKAWDYIDHISHDYRDAEGKPTTERFVPELRQVRHESSEQLNPASTSSFSVTLEQRLTRNFPAKCAYVGVENVRQALGDAIRSAGAYGITTIRGATLFAMMRFILGGSFDQDPLIPWASSILRDETIADQTQKTDKLYAAGVAFLGRWWDASFKTGDLSNVLG